METYDVIVVGGGPGGYMAAELAGKAGLSCLLAEERAIGGVCLNEGCIPSKSLLYSAKIYGYGREGRQFGVTFDNPSIDQAQVVARKNKTVKTLVGGVESMLKRLNVKLVYASASLEGRDAQGYRIKAGGETYAARNVILATGSEPAIPGIPGLAQALEDGRAVTSRGILDLAEVPPRLAVIGGGVVGLEMAAYYSAAGAKVTVIEMLDQIAGSMDAELSALLMHEMKRKGVDFYLSSMVTAVNGNAVAFTREGREESVAFDRLLLSAGRRARFAEGLEKAGQLTQGGFIAVDAYCRTAAPGVYAVGDVTGKAMLAHVAYRQAEAAVGHLLGKQDAVDYSAIPSVIYTQPEVAWAGLSEQEAKQKGYCFDARKASVNMSGRHVAEHGITSGVCKLLVDRDVIIGGGLIGAYASEIVYALVLMVQNRIPVSSIRRTMFPHPTVCEVIREALYE